MGVQDLWPILEPVRESVPLYSLSGKTLAVDLSLWVCEAQHVQAMMGRVTKPHLRNLFFRVSSLTLMGIKPVFVMEGEAPKIKAETMSKRTETRFAGLKKNSAPKVASNATRGRFNAVLRECAEMLDYLGVPWVKAAGEAEAMCAYLDSQGLVDGCITNDGDAFLYGARTVYNNFNTSSKDPQVDCYKTCRVETELQLCRENLVGLAILLGCDYIPKGVLGVGKEHALKYIQSLKGQTLLQKISQWREDNAEVFECVSKKVSHCPVCRHPGSAKTHERSGCVFCHSTHFCEPQDFDYQCPCDWHRREQRRQALSLETNIRKKTLASPQFPFREIINEFLVSKDKPVSHFRRRQPNMLLMQKFAYDKMEWPRHYTSEKVLVLMTYTELMNRKHGKESTSQIRPVRILKPRVRNGVSCFEVIWSKPEHYVFPEDHSAEDQHEVRTVEEESLFSVAFPKVVEHYLQEKALAEENKLKKKKSKRKKEQKEPPPDVCDGISDLLAQMNLQTSPNATVEKQISPTADSCTGKTEVLLLDTPVNHRQRKNSNADQGGLDDLLSTPLSTPHSEATVSPSVSAVIDALHLSDIDWNAVSFTSSPAPQVSKNDNSELSSELFNDHHVTQTTCEDTELDTRPVNTRPAAEPCFTESSLRDRVLMKNAAKSINQHLHSSVVPTEGRCEVDVRSLKFTKGGGDVKVTGKDSGKISDKSQCFLMKADTQTTSLVLTAKNQQVKDLPLKKPPQKYTFVKTTSVSSLSSSSSSSALKQRCNSCPCPGDKDRKMPQTSKKSVCLSLGSSSDDSDGENQQLVIQRKTKIKPSKKFPQDLSLKSTFRSNPSKHTVKTNHCQQPLGLKSNRLSADVDVSTTPVSTKSRGQDGPTVTVDGDSVFSPAPSLTVVDSDDSVVGSDSPLPLAERLRLKFIK